MWFVLRWLLLATWLVPIANLAGSFLSGNLPTFGAVMSTGYAVVVLSLSYSGGTGSCANATGLINSALCVAYLVQFWSLQGSVVVLPLAWFVGAVLRWWAVVSLGRCVTWDRFDLRGNVTSGIYRWVAHPMTVGALCYFVACLPYESSHLFDWLRWSGGVASTLWVYVFEDVWYRQTVNLAGSRVVSYAE